MVKWQLTGYHFPVAWITCGACALRYESPSGLCPRCQAIDALVPDRAPPSPISNSLLAMTEYQSEQRPIRIDLSVPISPAPPVTHLPEEIECPQCAEKIKLRAKL